MGTAPSTAQVDRFTPANVQIGDVFTLTATGEDGSTAAVSFTATAATVANVTAGLVAAWNASTNSLHTPITAADATTSLTLTADVAGVPFSVASTTTDGGGANTQTLTRAAVTANSGPSSWNTAANWSGGSVPVNSDSVTLDQRMAAAVLYGLDQSAVALTKLTIQKGSKAVGTVSAPLRISATTCEVNKPPTDGSNPSAASVVNLDFGLNATTCTVWGSASSGSTGLEPVMVKGTHTSNVLNVYDGSVGLATNKPADTATVPTINARGSNTRVTIGSGSNTVTALNVKDAKVILRTAASTVTTDGGTLVTEGSGAITTANIAGAADLQSTGTITTLNIEPGGDVTTVNTARTATISNCSIYGTGRLTTDLNTTYTNGYLTYRGARNSQVDYPDGTKFVPSAAP